MSWYLHAILEISIERLRKLWFIYNGRCLKGPYLIHKQPIQENFYPIQREKRELKETVVLTPLGREALYFKDQLFHHIQEIKEIIT